MTLAFLENAEYICGKLKKIFTIFIAVVYLAVSSGIVMEVHHCMGKLAGASVSLFGKETHKCGTCGMVNAKNSCCKDELKLVKLQDSHKQVSFDFLVQAPAIATTHFPGPIAMSNLPLQDRYSYLNHSPPNIALPSLCILHCNFRV